MGDFHFVPLGVGNAFSALYYSSCLALHAEGIWLLVDCPHPIRKILHESSRSAGCALDIDDFSGLVLTHLHGDHASGLEMYGFFSHYALGGKAATLYTHPEVAAHLWHGHLSGSMGWSAGEDGEPAKERHLHDFFDVHFLSESQPQHCGPFAIECRRTVHSIPTTALRINAAGRTLGYSADTAYDRSLINWLAESDLIIHETGEGGLHTPYKNLEALPRKIKQKMRLIHYGDDFDENKNSIDRLRQGVKYSV